MDDRALNPHTGRWIKPGKAVYEKLIYEGYKPTRYYYNNKKSYLIVMRKPDKI